ncbi:glycosyltransferase family 4 protein [Halomonas lysinitropha]|uniref:Glycogen synthase n=1 Tax=Halomonas lysinitropha TaxID=2607506 RepID=A0A5K1I8C0_9GAMM|nr:glycosyltransferase [Halomonas lysinitropha]VVZ95272.1 Glycogen synthase [Halomonas lysinitropha]
MKVAIIAPSPVPFTIGGAEKLWWGLWQHLNRESDHQAELIKLPSPERTLREVMASYRRFSELDVSHFDAVITTKYPAWMVSHPDHRLYLQHPLRGLYDTWPWPELSDAAAFDDADGWPDPLIARPALAAAEGLPAWRTLRDLLAAAPRREHLGELFAAFESLAADITPTQAPLLAFPGPLARALVQHLDRIAMAPEVITRYSAISATVAHRPGYFPAGARVQVLPHPSDLDVSPPQAVTPEQATPRLFTCSRLEAPKRLDLLIRAFRRTRGKGELWIAGSGPERAALAQLAAEDPRIHFLGFLRDSEIVDQYRAACAVPFIPRDEDLGLITLEAMAVGRPVITCTDSGGPTEFVEDGMTGWCIPPEEAALAEALDAALSDPAYCSRLGRAARERTKGISWQRVAEGLLGPAPDLPVVQVSRPGHWLVLNTFAVTPPRGGGQNRIYHLYRHLARQAGVRITLLCLDTQAESERQRWIAPGLEEHCIPLTPAQFTTLHRQSQALGAPLDDLFAIHGWVDNPAFLAALARHAETATLGICAHPYLVHAMRAHGPSPWWYEAHNVEAELKRDILAPALASDDLATRQRAATLLDDVEQAEATACRDSAEIIACAEEDLAVFRRRYGLPQEKGVVVPNCADLERLPFIDMPTRRAWQRRLGMARPVALFIASWHGPNLAAARFIAERLAPAHPTVDFVLVGSLCQHPQLPALPVNMRAAGLVSEAELKVLLASADIALNPMLGGSGSNLKMLDYTASGVPVLTTFFGNRGLDFAPEAVWLAAPGELSRRLHELLVTDDVERQARVSAARCQTEAHFDWASAVRALARPKRPDPTQGRFSK